MRNPFQPGATKHYTTVVTADKLAAFPEEGLVHPLYSTFALARDAEWVCRLFVLDMLEPGEQGIGGYVSVRHLAPAKLDSEVHFTATLQQVEGNKISCTYFAEANGTRIAEGEQEQRVLNKARFYASLGLPPV
jgi:predicted thioesterase